ncbi:MAG: transcription-repair coupling factor [Bacteroidaceae bacterium]|nr:transcription-repair coupling factor [Bacteroidaceae bacterium]
MQTNKVLSTLAASDAAKKLAKRIRNSNVKQVKADGLCGSSAALLLASIMSGRSNYPKMLLVMNDLDDAGYVYHDLTQMLGEERVLFFPSSYRRAIKYNQKDAGNEILRTEVLTKVADAQGLLMVTYPDALAERVMSKQELEENTLSVKVGDLFDISELEKRIFELGFERTDYVYEPGQFAVRGSIVDVYSFSSDMPYRIDFFGDEVDSIRSFDVQSQLSQGKVEMMTIVPEIKRENTKYISFLEFLPKDTLVVTQSLVYVCDKIAQIHEEGFSSQAQFEAETNAETLADQFIIDEDTFKKQIVQFRQLELKQGKTSDEKAIHFNTTPQPLFHKNFDLVNQEFRRLMDEGYKICIFSDSEKQIARLQNIFEEQAQTEVDKIHFTPVNKAIHEGFIDHTLKLCFFTDHQLFDRFHKYNLKSDKARRGKVALTLKEIQQFEIGDYVVHIDHGVGRFGGLVRVPQGDVMQEMIKIIYKNEDTVYVSIHSLHKVSKYKGKEGEPPRLNKIGGGAWERMKERVKTKVKDIARDLIQLYAARLKEKGFAYSKDSYMQHELEASFTYEDTPDQLKATQDVKADMEKPRPMDRLVCGDVGFGKTEVAIRAAFKAATDGKQVAVMVPTTVLAYQHYQTFSSRLKEFPVRVEYLTRARTAKDMKQVLDDLQEGKVDIIIGTHKLIGKQVKFKDLGLLIIDEEQKFGVSTKEKLRSMKVNVDTLTMTATPIPRTLQFSLLGARDLSIIQTSPPNRYPIQTEIHTFSPEIFAEAINFEMSRNGQVFIVNNKISNLRELEAMIHKYVPDARVCVGHGQMNPQELEKVILDFMNYDYDVMLSTTIVENGIDVPNANTIIINSAQNYGLSDIHQMRGRVGRSNRKAFCYLIAPPLAALNDVTRRRLQAVENFSDLGSGIHIAMQDLDIRGAGNMLGAEQSGFITDLGYETYQKILNEAVAELKENEFNDLFAEEDKDEEGKLSGEHFVTETNVESDIQAFFPEEYVPSSSERMSLYRELDSLTIPKQLEDYKKRLIDRFGQIPPVGESLLAVMPIKWSAQRLGIEKVVLKMGRMILYFALEDAYFQSRAFEKVLNYVAAHGRGCTLRDGERKSLLIKGISTMEGALSVLEAMEGKGTHSTTTSPTTEKQKAP